MIFNEIKCRVNTSLGLVGGMQGMHPPCVRACLCFLLQKQYVAYTFPYLPTTNMHRLAHLKFEMRYALSSKELAYRKNFAL